LLEEREDVPDCAPPPCGGLLLEGGVSRGNEGGELGAELGLSVAGGGGARSSARACFGRTVAKPVWNKR
jgi:hypothetical protein